MLALLPLSAVAAGQNQDSDAVVAALSAADVPGVAIAVVRDGQLELHSHGSAGPGRATAVTGDTVFEAASLSKTVFATMFMEQVEDEKASLDSPLAPTEYSRRVVDRDAYRRLTPRLLLSHQSGLPNWAGDAGDPARSDPLEFNDPPGTGFGYSGEGYELLRAHLELRTSRSLEALFADARTRYGMPSSRYAYESRPPGSATAKGPDAAKNRAIDPAPVGIAAASLVTTAGDYGRFMRYLLDQDELLEQMLKPQVEVEAVAGQQISWGLGWGIFDRIDGRRLAFHWGDNFQFKAFVAIDPAHDIAVAYFANGVNGLQLVETIVEPVVGDLRAVRDWLGYED